VNNNTAIIGELTAILHSKSFYILLEEHKKSLQGEVNRYVKSNDMLNAYGALRAMNDVDRILTLMQAKITELKGS
jgi:hypothetical protein